MTKRVVADKNDWETGAEIYLEKQFIAKQVAVANNGVHSWPNKKWYALTKRNWGIGYHLLVIVVATLVRLIAIFILVCRRYTAFYSADLFRFSMSTSYEDVIVSRESWLKTRVDQIINLFVFVAHAKQVSW